MTPFDTIDRIFAWLIITAALSLIMAVIEMRQRRIGPWARRTAEEEAEATEEQQCKN